MPSHRAALLSHQGLSCVGRNNNAFSATSVHARKAQLHIKPPMRLLGYEASYNRAR